MANLISNLEGFTLPNMHDRWRWSLSGDGEYSVASVRNLIDDRTLVEVGAKTRWIKYVPIKVNFLLGELSSIIFRRGLISVVEAWIPIGSVSREVRAAAVKSRVMLWTIGLMENRWIKRKPIA
ncbi:hypothetical protein Tco_0509723 [Tanacetum coccineum]